jgi:predicted RNA-binding Zn-ribbon protein involved in translation (DUF1610 family)
MNQNVGVMRCTREGCGGLLEASGQEVTRLVCPKCGQNYLYQVQVLLVPVAEREPEKLLPPVDRAQ